MTRQIGRYLLRNEVARGGMGVVYRAYDPAFGRDVAIKLLLGERAMESVEAARFEREVVVLAKLQHPNIVRIHSVELHDGMPFFVQDLVEGETLADRIAREGRLPVTEAANLTRILAGALQRAHDEGILHRDLKPSNVILRGSEPVLIDFGIAKDMSASLSGDLSKSGLAIGTPGYWSPEQALGERGRIGPASDVYSLGATLYGLLVGQPPFVAGNLQGNAIQTVSKPAPAPSSSRADIEPGLDAICLKCLEKEPANRYASARDLETDLELFLAGERPLAQGGATPQSRARRRKLRLVATALALPTFVALVLLGVPPSLDVRSPLPDASIPGNHPLSVEILADGLLPVHAVEVDGTPAVQGDDGLFSANLVGLPEGEHTLAITARGPLRSTATTLNIHVDSTAPVLSVTSPLDYSIHDSARITLHGTVRDASPTEVFVPGGASTRVSPGEPFALAIDLPPGLNEVEIHARDAAGNFGGPLLLHLARAPIRRDTERLLRPFIVQGEPNTYFVTSDLEVSRRERLVLAAGTILRFAPTARLICRGELWALGTEHARVRMVPTERVWGGLVIRGAAAFGFVDATDVHDVAPGLVPQSSQLGGKQGGGISVTEGAQLVMVNSVVSGCRTAASNGGGLYVVGQEQIVSDAICIRTQFKNCGARSGGGAYFGQGSTVFLANCLFEANRARVQGGGLAAEGLGGGLRLEGVTFSENVSEGRGGGASVDRLARLTACSFSKNKAEIGGGGLDSRSAGAAGGVSELVRVHFLENEGGAGGGASLRRSFRLSDCTFDRNRASLGGGGLGLGAPGVFHLEGLSFSENVGRAGGGVNIWRARVVIERSEFVDNSGGKDSTGGGLRLDSGQLECRRSIFRGNQATSAGGLYCAGQSPLKLKLVGCSFLGNRADQRGGGLLIESAPSQAEVAGCEFKNNRATDGGGIYVVADCEVRLEGSRFLSNRAKRQGGGVGVTSTGVARVRLLLLGCRFDGNASERGSGLFLGRRAVFDDSSLRANGLAIDQAERE